MSSIFFIVIRILPFTTLYSSSPKLRGWATQRRASILFITTRILPIMTLYLSNPRFTTLSLSHPKFRRWETLFDNNNINNQGVTRVVQNLGGERLSSHNNNFSNQGVTRVVVNIFTKYNNGTTTMTMTKTHRPLVNAMLGLGGCINGIHCDFYHSFHSLLISFSMGQGWFASIHYKIITFCFYSFLFSLHKRNRGW